MYAPVCCAAQKVSVEGVIVHAQHVIGAAVVGDAPCRHAAEMILYASMVGDI